MNCAYWTKRGIKNCGKQFIVKFKHEQARVLAENLLLSETIFLKRV